MNVLAIDTALEACSVAVARPERPVVFATETIGRGHAERLFGMVQAVLADAGTEIGAIDRVVVTTGPGSFTGIRVGIAAARGFALVLRKPAVGVTTLAAHAAAARAREGAVPVLALLPAKGGDVFFQLFAADGSPIGTPEVGPAERAARTGVEAGGVLAGAGAPLVAGAWRGDSSPVIVHVDSAPAIAGVAALGLAAEPDGAPPRPVYVRPPDAMPAARAAVARR